VAVVAVGLELRLRAGETGHAIPADVERIEVDDALRRPRLRRLEERGVVVADAKGLFRGEGRDDARIGALAAAAVDRARPRVAAQRSVEGIDAAATGERKERTEERETGRRRDSLRRHRRAGIRHPQASRSDDGVFRVAILGDSVAHGTGDESGRGIAGNLDALLGDKHVIENLGIDGARTWNVLALLRNGAAIATCDAVVISIGGNDLFGDSVARLATLVAPSYAMDRAIARVAAIVAAIHRRNPATRVILLGLYDPYRRPFLDEQVAHWDARLIERFARDRAVDVVRIADVVQLSPLDHFHPGAAGYAAIAARVAPALR
jgi:lysophospholipase L1-like esterase